MVKPSRARAAGDIDRFIGGQIRTRRLAVRLSQEALAEAIGVTFQQIQKYEGGSNRVSAATLFRIAQVLDTEVNALLPSVFGAKAAAESAISMQAIAELAQPWARLNGQGRGLLAVLAKALASQPSLRA